MLRIRIEIILSKEEATELKRWRRRRSMDSRLRFRAAVILDCAHGFSIREVAKRHETSERTVSRWRRRFFDGRLEGLMTGDVTNTIKKPGRSGSRNVVARKLENAQAGLAGIGQAIHEGAANIGEGLADAAKAAAEKAADVGAAALDAGAAGVNVAADVGEDMVQAARDGANKALSPFIVAAQAMQDGFRRLLDSTTPFADWLWATSQGVLASNLAADLNGLLQEMVKGTPTIYDMAMDAVYNAASEGGALHRLFDGSHTIYGAFKAAHNASPDDSFLQEVFGTILGLLRDGTTPMGLPLATWSKETFDQVAGWLQSNFHIPKSWFVDLATYDAVELMGATIGVLAVALAWKTADVETFSKLVGGMGLAAVVSANPLLLIVTVVALARAFHKARETGEDTANEALLDSLLKGAFAAGATLSAVALVSAAGGPAGVALLVGLVAGVLAAKTAKNVSIADVGDFLAKHAAAIAEEVKQSASRRREWWPNVTARGLRFHWRPIG